MPWTAKQKKLAQAVEHGFKPTGKVCHCNEKRAKKAAASLRNAYYFDGEPVKVYYCQYGEHWHLAHDINDMQLRRKRAALGELRNPDGKAYESQRAR